MPKETGGSEKPITGRVRLLSGIAVSKKIEKGMDQQDRLLDVLKHRYGYINDKAVIELIRLFRQFSEINKVSGIRGGGEKLSLLADRQAVDQTTKLLEIDPGQGQRRSS